MESECQNKIQNESKRGGKKVTASIQRKTMSGSGREAVPVTNKFMNLNVFSTHIYNKHRRIRNILGAYCTLRNETKWETKRNGKRNETEYFNK